MALVSASACRVSLALRSAPTFRSWWAAASDVVGSEAARIVYEAAAWARRRAAGFLVEEAFDG
jgi:hypothetical protein